MTVQHTTKKGKLTRDFKPLSLEYKDSQNRRTIRGVFTTLSKGEKDKEREVKWNETAKVWAITV